MKMKQVIPCLSILPLLALAGCGSPNPDPLPNAQTVGFIRGGAASSTGGAATPAVAVGEGWGTLKGVFLFGGDPPSPKSLPTGGKDPQACGQIPDESLLVDPQTKGIKNIVVFARKTARVHEDAAKPASEQVFDQKACIFLTHVLPVVVGEPVTIKNSDPVGHNTNLSPTGDVSSNNSIPAGSQSSYTFGRPQNDPVPVTCSIHPWMKAFMFPRKDTYVGVTKADGSFEIPNLPAGEELEFQVWHEKQPKLAADPKWSQGRFKVTIPKDGVHDLGQIQVPPGMLQ
jgi:hypothetical protein